MSLKSYILFSTAALVALPMASAVAADYDPPVYAAEAPEYVPVEVGSGWYLRGDVRYDINRPFRRVDFGITPVNYDEDQNPISGSIGFGYHFNDYLRADINFGLVPGNRMSASYDDGVISASGSLRNRGMYGMANAYVDLGTYVGLTPYLGAGIGIYRSKRTLTANYSDAGDPTQNFALHDNKTQYSAAYTLNAGVSYMAAPNLSIDLGYQFLSAPGAEYAAVEDLASYPIHKGLNFHQVRLGLRYDLW